MAEEPTLNQGTQSALKEAVPAATAPTEPQPAVPPSPSPQPDARPRAPVRHRRDLYCAVPGWLVSMVLHAVALMILAVLALPPRAVADRPELSVVPGVADEIDQTESFLDAVPEPVDLTTLDPILQPAMVPDAADVDAADDIEAAAVAVNLGEIGLEHAPKNDLLTELGAFTGSELAGRGAGRARMVTLAGGSEGSERAVALALKWLAEHQMADGGWSFDHTRAPACHGQCRNPGRLTNSRNAATGLALLPFLGAGQTHKESKYKETVKRGLYFLVHQMHIRPEGGSLREPGGQLYSHGIASIALCEAYAMTEDRALYDPAQHAINYICYAQDPVGGGWRYEPQQAGDTSVVGWQIMALKSGYLSYLRIPPLTVKKASQFLDSVQGDEGAHYGYTDPPVDRADWRAGTTAVGLLCRMYLGWKKDNPALERGILRLSKEGPDRDDLYYNYYATMVMRQWEGEPWQKWNSVMRDQLVNSQATKGHERGSWIDGSRYAMQGGRLYSTAMATMILEVYYRYMPIYGKQSTESDFPLD